MAEKVDVNLSRYIVRTGTKFGFGYAIRSNGNREARDFYMELLQANPTALGSLKNVFEQLMEIGTVSDIGKFRKVVDGIWEVKHHSGARVFCFLWNGVWWATHGCMKKQPKTPPEDKERALQIMKEHLDRFRRNP